MTQPNPQKEDGPPAASSKRAKLRSALEPLKSLAGVAGVFTGIAFIDGWLYWATYYTAFGLNPLVLDFPLSVVSVSPVQVLVRDWMTEPGLHPVLILLAVVCIALGVLFVYWYKRGHAGATVLLFAGALGMSASAWTLGFHDAKWDAGCQSRLPSVSFELIAPPEIPDPSSCLGNPQVICKLVLHNNNTYHYFVAPDPGFCGGLATLSGAGFSVAEMPDSQIRIANIQRYLGF